MPKLIVEVMCFGTGTLLDNSNFYLVTRCHLTVFYHWKVPTQLRMTHYWILVESQYRKITSTITRTKHNFRIIAVTELTLFLTELCLNFALRLNSLIKENVG